MGRRIVLQGLCRNRECAYAVHGSQASAVAWLARTMRLSSGRQEPQLVPHFSDACRAASRSPSEPDPAASWPAIAVSRHVEAAADDPAARRDACRRGGAGTQQQPAVGLRGQASCSSVLIQASALVSPASRKPSRCASLPSRTRRTARRWPRLRHRHSAGCRCPARAEQAFDAAPGRRRAAPRARRRETGRPCVRPGAFQRLAGAEGHAAGEGKGGHQPAQLVCARASASSSRQPGQRPAATRAARP